MGRVPKLGEHVSVSSVEGHRRWEIKFKEPQISDFISKRQICIRMLHFENDYLFLLYLCNSLFLYTV